MATAVHSAMTMAPFNSHSNQCIDPDQEFFDFGALPSPTPATLKRESSATSSITSPTSAIEEDFQTPAKPSHEYGRFKQQTGLPSGSIAGLSAGYNSGFGFSSTGLDEMALMDSSWSTGLAMDSSMNLGVDYQQSGYFFNDDFVDPSAITQEEVPNVRVYPGVHQQAALAKAQAQAQAQQQRQQQLAHQKLQAAQQQLLQAQPQSHSRMQSTSHASRKTSSPLSDARTEETIARVVAQIRADSHNASSMQDNSQGLLPHIIRAKKDEDDMDEDERLLASEEGKKLSSKERRQLRNKVSARAFRSRRKEYIGQLEGEVAVKVNEANELRVQNRALMEENARSQAFIERLLRHQAFAPFLEDLVQEAKAIPSSTPTVPTSNSASFQSQQFGSMSQAENTHVGMTMVPETQVDFSMLNLNTNNNGGNNWGVNNGFTFQQPRVFAVLEVPEGPSNPLDTEAMSGKGYSAIFDAEEDSSAEEVKPEYPVIERPVQSEQPTTVAVEDVEEEDSEYALYFSSPAPSAVAPVSVPLENHEQLFANPEKALAHYSLTISDEAQETRLAERLERKIAAMEPVLQRLAALTSMLDS